MVPRLAFALRHGIVPAGILVTVAALSWSTGGYREQATPTGSDWFEYRAGAHILIHHEEESLFPAWRSALYPLLLGLAGERMGYTRAATWLSSSAVVVMALSAALGAWALAGRWAAWSAALAAMLMPVVPAGSHWMTPYPMAGAVVGVALALGVWAVRRPSLPCLCLAGLAAGFGWGLDSRCLPLVPCVVVLAGVGLLSLRGEDVLYRLSLALLFGACLSVGPFIEHQVAVKDHANLLEHVEAVATGDQSWGPDLSPGRAAGEQGLAENLSSLEEAAGQLAEGLTWQRMGGAILRMVRDRTLPPLPLLGLVLLVVVPRRGEASTIFAGVVVLAVLAFYVFVPVALVPVGARHSLFFIAPLAMVTPVVIYRAVGLVLRPVLGVLARPAAASAAFVAVLVVWAERPPAGQHSYAEDEAVRAIATWLGPRLGESDTLRECAVLGLEPVWYPKRLHDGSLDPYGGDWESCVLYLENPGGGAGTRWLVTVDPTGMVPPGVGRAPFTSPLVDPREFGWSVARAFRIRDGLPAVIAWHHRR